MVACLPLVQHVRGSIPGGVVNFHLKIFNLGARKGGDAHFLISRLKYIVIQWIPAHVGLQCNEMADILAKKGTTLSKINTILDAQEIKSLLRKRAMQNYKLTTIKYTKDKQ